MKNQSLSNKVWIGLLLAAAAVAIVATVTNQRWLPRLRGTLGLVSNAPETRHQDDPSEGGRDARHGDENHAHGSNEAHDESHPGHEDESAIEFTVTGLKNIDYRPITVELSDFSRSINLPAMVVERPGHSQIYLTAPLTGVITQIHPVEGAAIQPGSPMFEVRLTHEELVAAQRNFLQTVESLDVVQREIDRLKAAGEGVIAGRRIIEQEYEQQKLEASRRAEAQALLLHGLTEAQIERIQEQRQLLQLLTVFAPSHDEENEACSDDHLFHVQKLAVKLGEQVTAGQLLCVVADHCELYIEGRAFEDDAIRLREALQKGHQVTAHVVAGRKQTDAINGLRLLYLADHVDPKTRAFRFYLRLPNEVALDRTTEEGHQFIAWRFNPGQRMELKIPVETWTDQIVLPITAIVEEGAETFVYERNGDHFDRVPVHVKYKDNRSAVIAADGMLKPGEVVAGRGAYQMHLALKNRAGGGVDPHAGHNH